MAAVVILFVDLILMIKLLPLLYIGVPVPYEVTGKPVGGILLPVTFFNILLIVANVFAFAYLLHKFGFNLGLIPKTRNDWLDVLVFFIFLISGMTMWYIPALFLAFLVSAVLLVAGQVS